MSVNTSVQFKCTTIETLSETTVPAATARSLTHNAFDFTPSTLNATSTVPASIAHHATLTGASGTIDLTSLATADGVKDASGKKLQVLRIRNRSEANDFVIDEGGTNGYPLDDQITIKKGGCAMFYFADQGADVAAGDKTLDWTFAADQEADITLILG